MVAVDLFQVEGPPLIQVETRTPPESENETHLLTALLNDSFSTEDSGPVNRKWIIKYSQVLGPGFYWLWGPFKRMTLNFPT